MTLPEIPEGMDKDWFRRPAEQPDQDATQDMVFASEDGATFSMPAIPFAAQQLGEHTKVKHPVRRAVGAVAALLVLGVGAGWVVGNILNSTNNHNARADSLPVITPTPQKLKPTKSPAVLPTASTTPTVSFEPTATASETVSATPTMTTEPIPTATVTETLKPEPAPTVTATVTATPSQTPEQTPTQTPEQTPSASTPATSPLVLIDASKQQGVVLGSNDWWPKDWQWGHDKKHEKKETTNIATFEQDLVARLQANGVNAQIKDDTQPSQQGDLLVTLNDGHNEVSYDTKQSFGLQESSQDDARTGCVAEKTANGIWQEWQTNSGDVAGPTDKPKWMINTYPSITLDVKLEKGNKDDREQQLTDVATTLGAAVTTAVANLQTTHDACISEHPGQPTAAPIGR